VWSITHSLQPCHGGCIADKLHLQCVYSLAGPLMIRKSRSLAAVLCTSVIELTFGGIGHTATPDRQGQWRYVALVVVLWRPALSSSASVTALR